jgi:hypothetical protein
MEKRKNAKERRRKIREKYRIKVVKIKGERCVKVKVG